MWKDKRKGDAAAEMVLAAATESHLTVIETVSRFITVLLGLPGNGEMIAVKNSTQADYMLKAAAMSFLLGTAKEMKLSCRYRRVKCISENYYTNITFTRKINLADRSLSAWDFQFKFSSLSKDDDGFDHQATLNTISEVIAARLSDLINEAQSRA